jgi:hypothetical protein
MFKNFSGICSSHTVKVILVSNVAFEFADTDVKAVDLDPKYRDKIVEKLKAELSDFSEDQISHLHFMITGVSIHAMQSFLHGEAMDLFKAQFGEDHGFNVHSWVRLLQSEIARKNNYPSDKIANVSELISKKCVARDFVEESLSIISARPRPAPDMSIVSAELKSAGWSASDLMRLDKRIPNAAADCTDATNLEVLSLVKRLEELFVVTSASDLCKFISQAENTILSSLSMPYRDPIYLAAVSLLVFYEKI